MRRELVESAVDGVDLAVALVDHALERRDIVRTIGNRLLSGFHIRLERLDGLGQDEHEHSQPVGLFLEALTQSVALGLKRACRVRLMASRVQRSPIAVIKTFSLFQCV